MTEPRDINQDRVMSSPARVNFDLEAGSSPHSPIGGGEKPYPAVRSEPDVSHIPQAPILRRRQTRSNTAVSFKTVEFNAMRPDWRPGQEPGLDPSKPNGGRSDAPMLHEDCQITVVDFSEDDMVMHDFGNEDFINFIEKPQDSWISCRWININGLSWDVIQAIGAKKKLHKLAIEDLVNTHNRTKADWYTDHTYIVLTLQKLVHMHNNLDSDEESDLDDTDDLSTGKKRRRGRVSKFLHKMLSSSMPNPKYDEKVGSSNGYVTGHTDGLDHAPVQKLRTLQRYHGGPNQERAAFMEAHSPLVHRNLVVSAEQVSIFLTSDNTVICFFESSADDVETPILHRLSTPDTILRRSCDASMLAQAVIDAIIDLAIPVTTAYQDVIGDLELDVLTEPSIRHTKGLYVVANELAIMRSFVSPIINLINALREHKSTALILGVGGRDIPRNPGGVKISPMAQTYLGDVEDHIVLITESLDQMRRSCDNMIDLIFNTISAYQNESMKQLTVITIIFLPLTFLTGYFGMNIVDFPAIHHNESYFWIIAIPVAFATTMFMLRDFIRWWFNKILLQRGISRSRKGRLARAEAKRNA